MSADYSWDFETIKVKFQNMGTILRSIEKMAIVGESKWMEIYIDIMDHLTPQQIKYFDHSEKDAAFAWLKG